MQRHHPRVESGESRGVDVDPEVCPVVVCVRAGTIGLALFGVCERRDTCKRLRCRVDRVGRIFPLAAGDGEIPAAPVGFYAGGVVLDDAHDLFTGE